MTRGSIEQRQAIVAIPVNPTLDDLPGAVSRACALGCPAVELAVDASDLVQSRDHWESLRTKLASTGLTCAGIAFDSADGMVLSAADAAYRAKAREYLLAALQRASGLGASYVRVVVARFDVAPTAAPRYEDAYHHALDALSTLRHEAGLVGVRIVIDTASHGFLVSPVEARTFIDAVNSPWVGASLGLDAGHKQIPVTDWIETLAHRLWSIRLDNDPAGPIDWDAIGRTLASERFDGVLVAPPTPDSNSDNRLITLRNALRKIAPSV